MTASVAATTAPDLADIAVAAMAQVVSGPAALHEPEFAGNEWAYVKDCIDTGWVSSAGRYVDLFEEMICTITGADHAIATVNGTSALEVSMLLAVVRSDDEVLAPALTFVGTANAISHRGAVPHFVDIEERTLGIDPTALADHLARSTERKSGQCMNKETGRRVGALICVHTFGHPADLDGLRDVSGEYGIPLIEDAAESLGSRYKGRHTGNHGLVAALSFNGNKTVTTGGGGAIVTNDADIASTARHLTTTAKAPHDWEYVHDEVGFNYRLPNINAALGCAQLEQLDGFLERKRRLAAAYQNAFRDVPGIRFFVEPEECESNYWLNALVLDPEHADQRDTLLARLNEHGFGSRPAWRPMHMLDMYGDCPRAALPVTEDLHRRLINIPSSAKLGNP